jgi:hypothetical protein
MSGGENTRWLYWFDAQARYFDIGSGINQWLARPGIGYKLNDSTNVWLGYGRFRSRGRSGAVVDENRYWQQIDWSGNPWHGGTLSLRGRLEQRFVTAGDDTGVVLRLMAKYVRPLRAGGNTSLILGVEPFFDLVDTDWGGDSRLGQNRAFVALGWRLNDSVSMETGYMNQYFWLENREDVMNHLGTVTFKVRF